MFKYYIYKFGYFCVNHLPSQFVLRLAIFISDLHFYFSFRDRRAVRNNLRKILNPGQTKEDISKLTREVFRNFGLYLAEFFMISGKVDEEFIQKNVRIENFGRLQSCLKDGKGVILLTGHIGNWELGAIILGVLGFPPMAIALPHKERPVNDLFNKQRGIGGVRVVPSSQAVRRCLEALSANECVAVVADRDFSANGEILDFFGEKMLIPKGAALFSLKTGAPILPTFLFRESDRKFVMRFHEPIYPHKIVPNGQVDRSDLLQIMKKHTDVIENEVRQHPTQWLMFRKFWLKPGDVPEVIRET